MGYRTIDTTFGDGSDGHAHFTLAGGATQLLDKPTFNYASLAIDAGVTVKQPNWSAQHWPVTRIYCRSTVTINGILSVSNVAGGASDSGYLTGDISDNGGGNLNGPGYPPFAPGLSIFPICGGGAGCGSTLKIPASGAYVPYYSAFSVGSFASPSTIWKGDENTLASLIGPGRMYRFCAGCGGGCGDFDGGNGGGIIIVTAPAIVFGPSGQIEAKGGDGSTSSDTGSGGGGGGYIETVTRSPVDSARLDVSGGASGIGQAISGAAGMDGFALCRLV